MSLPLRADLTPKDITQEKLYGIILEDGSYLKSQYIFTNRTERMLSGLAELVWPTRGCEALLDFPEHLVAVRGVVGS